jgi:hypothetical protein
MKTTVWAQLKIRTAAYIKISYRILLISTSDSKIMLFLSTLHNPTYNQCTVKSLYTVSLENTEFEHQAVEKLQ